MFKACKLNMDDFFKWILIVFNMSAFELSYFPRLEPFIDLQYKFLFHFYKVGLVTTEVYLDSGAVPIFNNL